MADDLHRQFDILAGRATRVANRRNIVEFYSEPYQDETLSEQQGRPIYRDVEYIRIMTPGDMRQIIERRAHAEDKVLYAREYDAFKKSETLSAEGTPLEQWSLLNRATVRQLKAYGVYTVDNLAGLTDGQISDIGMLGMRSLRNQAIAYLEHSKDAAASAKIVADNERLADKVAALEKALADANLRFETVVRQHGGDPSTMQAVAVKSPEPSSALPVAEMAPERPPIPASTKNMSNKDVLELAERLVGMKFTNRKDAEEAIAEVRDAAASKKVA